MHGTSDTTVKYRSNELVDGMIEPYLDVVSGSLQLAAEALGCTEPAIAAEYRAFDHDALVPERETDRYVTDGCIGRLEHWQMMGSKHIPSLTESWPFDLLTWSDQRP